MSSFLFSEREKVTYITIHFALFTQTITWKKISIHNTWSDIQ